MFPRKVATILHTRSRAVLTNNRTTLRHYSKNYGDGRVSFFRTTPNVDSFDITDYTTTMKRPRSTFPSLVRTNHPTYRSQLKQITLFSTKTTSNESPTTSSQTTAATTAKEDLPSSATTGNIASHLAPIPTERDIAMVGGVFSVTSAKRDKLTELNGALGDNHHSLDDLASKDELLDLYLADGIKLIAGLTDSGSDQDESFLSQKNPRRDFSEWLEQQLHDDELIKDGDQINRTALEIKFEVISAKVDNLLESLSPSDCLKYIRDYQDPAEVLEELKDAGEDEGFLNNEVTTSMDSPQFRDAVARYRLLLAKSAIAQISQSWKVLTTISDADIDRAAATEGKALEPEVETVSFSKIIGFLQSVVSGSCSDRVTAAWNLMDRDEDGSLDEEEMNQVIHLCLRIEVEAIQTLFQESCDVVPVRASLSSIDDLLEDQQPKGWRQRRKEKKAKKQLLKLFQKACQRHFDVEVEINHRLRCIYAWANKASQGNQLKSVVVDDELSTFGRKRYVELSPKISEAEFREVQEIHFRHLDRLGTEIVKSFREDLWVLQGKGRERKDLIKNSFLFLAGVSAVDYVILSL